MMQKTLATLVALSMSVGTLAVAQDRGRHDDRDQRYERHDDRRDDRHDDRSGRHFDERRGPPRGYESRGAGPDHRFYRGGRLPPEWRSRQYVITDWRSHRLNAPPRGYQWVQTGGDFVLVAIATGIIAQILLNN